MWVCVGWRTIINKCLSERRRSVLYIGESIRNQMITFWFILSGHSLLALLGLLDLCHPPPHIFPGEVYIGGVYLFVSCKQIDPLCYAIGNIPTLTKSRHHPV